MNARPAAKVGDRVQMRRGPIMPGVDTDDYDPRAPHGTVAHVAKAPRGYRGPLTARVDWDGQTSRSDRRCSLHMLRVLTPEEDQS